jgi:hypothetical protein
MALQAEILVLRHQLNVLQRKSPKRVALGNIDRVVLIGLYRLAPKVLEALKIMTPEVIRWHRSGFRAYWRCKSRPLGGRPKTSAEIRQLVREMSLANPFWGSPRIHASCSSLVSLSARRQWQNTWRGTGGHRHRAGRRFFAIILMPSRRLTRSSSRRFRFDCCMGL